MSNQKRIATRSKAKIIIRLMPTGRIQVTGPLAKDKLCLEMLREAERVIRKFHQEIAKQIVTPSPAKFSPANSYKTVTARKNRLT